ncbi:MAG: hypothetical protein FWC20_00615 [Oscillospiraceae bacterium]|nr:hypothetical protein [Oscillospiraceae bacterium]MCL2277895.1 hypothetical protein [Oscillospiraceae bacterium]
MLIGLILQIGVIVAIGLVWLVTKIDYLLIGWLMWEFVLNGEYALFANHDFHIAISILLMLIPVVSWFFIQQIRICGLYAFKLVACLICAGILGFFVGHEIDAIWGVVSGAVIFIICLALRSKNSELYQPNYSENKQITACDNIPSLDELTV